MVGLSMRRRIECGTAQYHPHLKTRVPMRTLTILTLFTVFVLPSYGDEPKSESEQAESDAVQQFDFNGIWKPRGATLNGTFLPPPSLEGITLAVSGDYYEVHVDGEDHADIGTFSIDQSVTPHRMEIKSQSGPNKGKTILAIFEIKGLDAMRVCYDLAGTAYPIDFTAPKGSGRYVAGYRRATGVERAWVDLLAKSTASLDEHWTTTGNWSLADGVATLTPREGEEGWWRWSSYLWSKHVYGDFDIQFEYKLNHGGNSGFYLRVGDVDDPVNQGVEVQLYATDPDKSRETLSDHDAGGIIPGLKPHRNASKPAGEWNQMTVSHFDNKIVVTLNGQTVNAHDLAPGGQLSKRPRVGQIGFQDHALPISLRNIRVRQPSVQTGMTKAGTR